MKKPFVFTVLSDDGMIDVTISKKSELWRLVNEALRHLKNGGK